MSTARQLHEDDRGAVMMTGLCMALFLIGGLWFLIGIGDTILFRDRMQEATDHAVFSSAALHAKGMNFISLMNMLLLALFTVHLIFGVVHDIALAVCIASLGAGCGAWAGARQAWISYHNAMKPIAVGIHWVGYAAANGYPLLGTAKGYMVGRDYGDYGPKKRKVNILPLGTTLVPGGAVAAAVGSVFKGSGGSGGGNNGDKMLLPVMNRSNKSVCRKIASSGVASLVKLAGQSPDGDTSKVFRRILGAGVEARYCNSAGTGAGQLGGIMEEGNQAVRAENLRRIFKGMPPLQGVQAPVMGGFAGGGQQGKGDTGTMYIDPGFDTFWGFDGPIVPWYGTANGGPFQQVWALNVRPEVDDEHARRVGFAQRKFDLGTQPQAPVYVSQAEFYFDCANAWDTEECNYDDNAGYAFKWRARLRRVALPEISSLLGGFGLQMLNSLGGLQDFRRLLGDKAGDLFGNNQFGKALTNGILEDFASSALKNNVGKQLGEVDKSVQGTVNATFGGMYH